MPQFASPLDQRREGEIDVWMTVCVLLDASIPEVGGAPGDSVLGYMINVGLRLPGPQPKASLEKLFPDGVVDWDETEYYQVDPGELDDELRKHVSVPDKDGVWYRSGKVFFGDKNNAG
ncbi:MAG: hypothetical protein JNM76_08315 [Betaproteobacteria bacterium]|nr:hypothetical protein [Betaproteobacteria bacterium]